jgi:hypothetical protein
MGKREIRKARREKQRRKKMQSRLILGGISIIALLVVGFLGWQALRPPEGVTFPIMENYGEHIEEGMDPGPFNSNPPTSGRHYGQEYDAGFYTVSSPQAQTPYPEGYLGHNLEHGYVIFWYNCGLLDDSGCAQLKTQIKGVMEKFDNFKLIAFPSDTLEVPLIMVSWGQMLRFDTFDESLASKFISVNRNQAPEPNAP